MLFEYLDDVRAKGNRGEVLEKWRGFDEAERNWVEFD